jgi:hypothetical protein
MRKETRQARGTDDVDELGQQAIVGPVERVSRHQGYGMRPADLLVSSSEKISALPRTSVFNVAQASNALAALGYRITGVNCIVEGLSSVDWPRLRKQENIRS